MLVGQPFSLHRLVIKHQRRRLKETFGTILLYLCVSCLLYFLVRDQEPELIARSVGTTPNLTSAMSSGYPSSILTAAILEGGGYHDEVTMAFAAAFAQTPSLDTTIYVWDSRFASGDILHHIARKAAGTMTLRDSGAFTRETFDTKHLAKRAPDLLVSVTCKRDLLIKGGALDYLLTSTNTTLLCVVHHSDKWEDHTSVHFRLAAPWMRKRRVKFVSLSPHVARSLQANPALNHVKIETFVPVFIPPAICRPSAADARLISQGYNLLALQGNFQAKRRNYSATFQALHHFFNHVNADSRLRLAVVGSGKLPDVPRELKDKVLLRPSLDYAEYYGLLSKSLAILPAFASGQYLQTSASSSIAAAVIAGIPLVADAALLEAYSYLDQDDVIMRKEGESELHAVNRLVSMDLRHLQRAKAQMKTKREILADLNAQLVQKWVSEFLTNRDEGFV